MGLAIDGAMQHAAQAGRQGMPGSSQVVPHCLTPFAPICTVKLPQYDPTLSTQALSDEELEELETQLDALGPDGALDLEALDGFVCGLLLSPGLPPADQWLPVVWGAEAPPPEGSHAPFASGKQLKRCVQAVLRHMGDVHRRLRDDAEGFEPIFSIAQLEDEEGTLVVDAEAWCIGFLQAAQLQPQAWDPLFEDPVCGPALAPITLLAADPAELNDDERALLDDVSHRDAISQEVQASIGKLWQARASEAPPAP